MTRHEPCVICPEPVLQRDGERRDRWLARKTCSLKCLGRLQSLLKAGSITREYLPHLPCPICRKPIEQRTRESRWDFNKRQTCDEKCYSVLRLRNTGAAPHSINVRRKALGVSRYALAVAAKVSDRTAGYVEAGRTLPQAEAKLLAALDRIEASEDKGMPDPGWPEIAAEPLPAMCFAEHSLSIRAGDFHRTYRPVTHIEREANS